MLHFAYKYVWSYCLLYFVLGKYMHKFLLYDNIDIQPGEVTKDVERTLKIKIKQLIDQIHME